MANTTIDEKHLEELIEQAVQKHLKLTFEDMEEVRRSPAGAIVRVETRLDAFEKTMATKADIANLRTRVEAIEETMATKADVANLGTRVEAIEKSMTTKADIAELRTEFHERIGQLDSKLSDRIGRVETTLSERIGKLEASNKLIMALVLSIFGAVVATLIKLFFFS